MSTCLHDLKVLALGHGQKLADQAQECINALGYKNVRVISIDNDQQSDDRLLRILKEGAYDVVTIGGYINCYHFDRYTTAKMTSEEGAKEREETFYWFNRLVNLVHEQFPKIKFVFVKDPNDIHNGLQRVLGGQYK